MINIVHLKCHSIRSMLARPLGTGAGGKRDFASHSERRGALRCGSLSPLPPLDACPPKLSPRFYRPCAEVLTRAGVCPCPVCHAVSCVRSGTFRRRYCRPGQLRTRKQPRMSFTALAVAVSAAMATMSVVSAQCYCACWHSSSTASVRCGRFFRAKC